MCLKYDYAIEFQLVNQFNTEDMLVEIRDNIQEMLLQADITELDEYQDEECKCNLEEQ
jgi:hypothetical protein